MKISSVSQMENDTKLISFRSFVRILTKQEIHLFLFQPWKDNPRKILQVVGTNSKPCDKFDRETPNEELIILKACKQMIFISRYLFPNCNVIHCIFCIFDEIWNISFFKLFSSIIYCLFIFVD